MSKEKDKEYTGVKEIPEEKKVKKEETVMITFKQNRKYDLHVGRDVLTFRSRETKPIPKEWLKHPDFKQAQKYFIVKGV